jgi:regulator of replication initiation timing
MQSKLLAKVEELTLHMIQAEERNNRLEEQNRELRDRIGRLEKGAAASATPAAAK